MFTVVQTLAGSWQNYGIFILETIAILIVIALGAWAVVRFGGNRLARGKEGNRMRVVERLALEPKRSLYLVEVDGKPLLIGVSEGAMQRIEQVSAEHVSQEPETELDNRSSQEGEER
jgi:flagellar biosynthetic protein FliO